MVRPRERSQEKDARRDSIEKSPARGEKNLQKVKVRKRKEYRICLLILVKIKQINFISILLHYPIQLVETIQNKNLSDS
jgi:hypothetical protein